VIVAADVVELQFWQSAYVVEFVTTLLLAIIRKTAFLLFTFAATKLETAMAALLWDLETGRQGGRHGASSIVGNIAGAADRSTHIF